MQRTPAEGHACQGSGLGGSSCCQWWDQSYLVISLTEELQPLSSFVHEDAIKVAGLHRSDLNGLLSPSHDLIGADVSCGRNVMLRYFFPHIAGSLSSVEMSRTNRSGHLAPLQHHVLNDPAVGVDVDAFVLVTQKHFHPIGAGQEHDGMWRHLALDLI